MATSIKAGKRDVIWNYVGTVVSMTSGFMLLPLLLWFLNDEELGLWYVYVAVSNLTQLFEFGFNPTFARNIVYCLSGADGLSKSGVKETLPDNRVDWRLLKALLLSSKLVYAAIAVVALIAVSSVGSLYVAFITEDTSVSMQWVSWGVFCASMFLNLYFLYASTFLRGVGDIAGENKAKTIAKITQLGVSALLLVCGFGLLGASIGFLANGLILRVLSGRYFSRHTDVQTGLSSVTERVSKEEVADVLSSISSIAWRDGAVQIALYASTQATSIISSLFLGLAETGMYSVLLQLATAVCNFAGAFVKSFYPMFQSSFINRDFAGVRQIVARGVSLYWLLYLFGSVGVILVIFPLLPLIRPGVEVSIPFFLFLSLYLALLNHHSIFCNFIIGMNEIPYMWGYIISAALGTGLAALLCGVFGLGVWGLIGAQFVVQLSYNNWKWPQYVMRRLDESYFSAMHVGRMYWRKKVIEVVTKRRRH